MALRKTKVIPRTGDDFCFVPFLHRRAVKVGHLRSVRDDWPFSASGEPSEVRSEGEPQQREENQEPGQQSVTG
jgi:hypothetical protein